MHQHTLRTHRLELGPLEHAALAAYVTVRVAATVAWQRVVRDEDGEGVISAAIAVLIMSFLGALMWFGFKAIWGDAETNTSEQVNLIGS